MLHYAAYGWSGKSASTGAFQVEQEPLLPEAPFPTPAAQAVGRHDPMTGDEQTDRVLGHDVPHRPGRPGLPRRLSHFPIASGLSPRNAAHDLIDPAREQSPLEFKRRSHLPALEPVPQPAPGLGKLLPARRVSRPFAKHHGDHLASFHPDGDGASRGLDHVVADHLSLRMSDRVRSRSSARSGPSRSWDDRASRSRTPKRPSGPTKRLQASKSALR